MSWIRAGLESSSEVYTEKINLYIQDHIIYMIFVKEYPFGYYDEFDDEVICSAKFYDEDNKFICSIDMEKVYYYNQMHNVYFDPENSESYIKIFSNEIFFKKIYDIFIDSAINLRQILTNLFNN